MNNGSLWRDPERESWAVDDSVPDRRRSFHLEFSRILRLVLVFAWNGQEVLQVDFQ